MQHCWLLNYLFPLWHSGQSKKIKLSHTRNCFCVVGVLETQIIIYKELDPERLPVGHSDMYLVRGGGIQHTAQQPIARDPWSFNCFCCFKQIGLNPNSGISWKYSKRRFWCKIVMWKLVPCSDTRGAFPFFHIKKYFTSRKISASAL